MIAFVNGHFLPAEAATVSVFDRGFLYGDGIFETLRVADRRVLLRHAHAQRLRAGLAALGIPLPAPHTPDSLLETACELAERNDLPNATVRLAVSRGPGPRGYSPRGAGPATLVLTANPAPPLDSPPPPPRHLVTSRLTLPPLDPLSPLKSASRLLHVLARAEAEADGGDDALLLNSHGHLAEAGSANLFWFTAEGLATPALTEGPLAGVTRALVLDIARTLGWSAHETSALPSALHAASGVFVTLATLGVVEVDRIDHQSIPRDPRLPTLRAAYLAHLHASS